MNIIETRPVGKIILNEKTPERSPQSEKYFIPYYQRGYRWETHHVEALLDDIDNFILSKEENYCLQPIVVAPHKDLDGFLSWEVIDGQQRLITLYVIFKHIQKYKYSIVFGQRNRSTVFLENLSLETLSHENPDFHFMSNAYTAVVNWFSKKTKYDIGYIDEFYTSITKKVQVIWYQVEELIGIENDLIIENKKIDIFNRLNVGKIPLTDAELIRALLLSKIKYGLTDREIDMRQAEISNEWNRMEQELRNEEFWYFLSNQEKDKYSSRIEFIFNLIAGGESSNYSTYLWFEKSIKVSNKENEEERLREERDNTQRLWNQVNEIYSKFRSWYNDHTNYHYIGYLLATNKVQLKTLLENSVKKKPEFKNWLLNKIKESVSGLDLKKVNYDKSTQVENVLLLFNVMSVEKACNKVINKFPFNHFKKIKSEDGGWSVEHIHAQQSAPINEEKTLRKWIEETKKSLESIPVLEVENFPDIDSDSPTPAFKKVDLKQYIDQLIKIEESSKVDYEKFNVLKEELIRLFDTSSVHEIENLALLSKKNNSALNNSIFPVKRNKIIELEKSGAFIPPCTRNVFLKFYSNSDNQPYYWSSIDKKLYFQEIVNILTPFLS